MNVRSHTESASRSEFERQAHEQCADLLSLVRENYAPSKAIESLVVLGFLRGAGWALGVEMPKVPQSDEQNVGGAK
jgi:hypothetical protein